MVSEGVNYAGSVPETLSEPPRRDFARATTRSITLSMASEGGANRWLINGFTHEMDEYPIVAQRGAKEIWEIRNDERSMPHPMHLHGFRFLVFGRTGSPEQVSRLAVDESGRTATDLGFKDTVLVWPGETVKLGYRFLPRLRERAVLHVPLPHPRARQRRDDAQRKGDLQRSMNVRTSIALGKEQGEPPEKRTERPTPTVRAR